MSFLTTALTLDRRWIFLAKGVQEQLGQQVVKTTMIYTHVLNRGPAGVRSPMDGL